MYTNIISRYGWETTKKNHPSLSRKSFRKYKWELNSLLFVRSLYAILTGILTTLFLHWNFFFITISLYCFVESIVVFTLVRRRKIIDTELDEEERTLTATQHTEISAHSTRYAFAYAMVGFYLSFVTITCFGALAKWTTELVSILFNG
jgi:hypothetical protein